MNHIRRSLLAVIVLCLIGGLGAAPAAAARVETNLNADWKFIKEDVAGAEAPAFDDSAWEAVSIPHTWNALDGEDGGNNYYRGPGWYRRHLKLAPESAGPGRCYFLHFDAASTAADVYVNGKPAGTHKGAFGAFAFDVTPLLDPAADNVIAVRVTNAKDKDIPPLSGDFTIHGGLYRGARLIALDRLSITPLDYASSGVYVRQTNVTPDHADLAVTTKLRNANDAEKTAAVKCEVVDAEGKVVASGAADQAVPARGASDAVVNIPLDHPHLWNGRKDPYLYHVRVTVSDGATATDGVTQPLGVRFYSIDPEKGFFLNGQSYPLHGVNRHQDRIDMGWAIGPQQQEEDYNLIAELGCTAVRLCHYEHAQDFYDLCDRGGMVAWAELCLVNNLTDSDAFRDNARQQLNELVRQNYNHPSICFWSLYNELGFGKANKNATAADAVPGVKHPWDLVSDLNQEAKSIDPDRLTTAACNLSADHPVSMITDVIAFNRYWGWYSGKETDWPGQLAKLHEKYPQRRIGISEYGAGASVHQHEADVVEPNNKAPWHPEEWQCVVHEHAYNAMKQDPWLWGTFLWCTFDFSSDGRHEGDHMGMNDKGLVTYDRKTKKDAFFFYQANWTTAPMVHINDRRFTPRNDATATIKAYSNCDSVDLKLNGKSLGAVTAPDHIFLWKEVPFAVGENKLEATGTTKDGKTCDDACTIVYDPNFIPPPRPVAATAPTTAPAAQP